jgi:hypothetical protein
MDIRKIIKETIKESSPMSFFGGTGLFNKEVPVPRYLYHQTSKINRGKILEEGLQPRMGKDTLRGFGLNPYNADKIIPIYLKQYGEEIKNYLPQPYGNVKPMIFFATKLEDVPLYGKEGYDIWEVDTERLPNKWYEDTFLPQYVCTDTPIPTKNLKLI